MELKLFMVDFLGISEDDNTWVSGSALEWAYDANDAEFTIMSAVVRTY